MASMTLANLRDVVTIFGTLLGFFSAWGLFELTERRRVRLAQKALREAVVAELQNTEVLLSTIVTKYAFLAETSEQRRRVASEWRWFARVGVVRSQGAGLALAGPPPVDRLFELSDDELVAAIAARTPVETVGGTLILPVINATLAGRTSGFAVDEITAMSMVRWQSHLLEQDAEWTAEFMRLSLTVPGENHRIVLNNHENRRKAYAHRAAVLLDCTRAALKALGAG